MPFFQNLLQIPLKFIHLHLYLPIYLYICNFFYIYKFIIHLSLIYIIQSGELIIDFSLLRILTFIASHAIILFVFVLWFLNKICLSISNIIIIMQDQKEIICMKRIYKTVTLICTHLNQLSFYLFIFFLWYSIFLCVMRKNAFLPLTFW